MVAMLEVQNKNTNILHKTSAFDVTRLTLLCQVGDDVMPPCKICGGARYASQDPFIHSTLSHTISVDSNLY